MLSLTRRRLVIVFALFCCTVFALTTVGTISMAGWAPSLLVPSVTDRNQASLPLTSGSKKSSDGLATSTQGLSSIGYTEVYCGAPPANWRQAEPVVLLPPHEFPMTVPVSIINFTFDPANVTINVGDTVMWTNNDGATHTTTSNGGVWDSGNLSSGQSFSFTFNSAGTFPYHCNIHQGMTGTVTVPCRSDTDGNCDGDKYSDQHAHKHADCNCNSDCHSNCDAISVIADADVDGNSYAYAFKYADSNSYLDGLGIADSNLRICRVAAGSATVPGAICHSRCPRYGQQAIHRRRADGRRDAYPL